MKETRPLASLIIIFFGLFFSVEAFIVSSKRTRSASTISTKEVSAIIRRDFRDVREEENNDNNNEKENEDQSTTTTTITKRLLRPTIQSPIKTFTSIIECFDTIDNALPNQLTVVLYFAHYCKLCHQTNIPYKKLAYSYEEKQASSIEDDNNLPRNIQFTRIETSVLNKHQFQSLGIRRVPFVQIYRNQICIASFSTNFKTLEKQLTDTIQITQQRSITDWLSFCNQYDNEIQSNKIARQTIRREVLMSNNERPNHGDLIHTAASEKQLLHAIDLSSSKKNNNTISVIMYHSHYEQACVRAQHQYRKVAEYYSDKRKTNNGKTASYPIQQ